MRRPLGAGAVTFTGAVENPMEADFPGSVSSGARGSSRSSRPGSALTKRELVTGNVLDDYSPNEQSRTMGMCDLAIVC